MRGLLYKDLLTIKGYAKSIILMLAVFIAVSFVNRGYLQMLSFIIPFVTMMLSVNTFSYDEYTKWDGYALTLPLTKKDMVKAKYILTLLLIATGSIVGFIIPLVISMITNADFEILNSLSQLAGTLFGIILLLSLTLPLTYKFGPEKGRIYMIAFVALIGLIVMGIGFLLKDSAVLEHLKNFFESYAIWILVALVIILFYGSYKLSYCFYKKREF